MRRLIAVLLLSTAAIAGSFAIVHGSTEAQASPQRATPQTLGSMLDAQAYNEGKLAPLPGMGEVKMAEVSKHYRTQMGHNAHRSIGGLHLMRETMCEDCYFWARDICWLPNDGALVRCFFRRSDGSTGCCDCRCVPVGDVYYPFGRMLCA